MRRPLTFSICALALALAPSVLYAQDPAAAAPKPTAPKLSFTTDAGLLLVQIKGDQTTAFEELVAKLKAGAAKAEDATVKAQLSSIKVYKTAEGAAGGNALYVILFDPATKDAEYELFQLLQKVMDTLQFKRSFLREAIDREYLIFFEHDPEIAAGYIREVDGRRRVERVL